jgi:hypothetical protein
MRRYLFIVPLFALLTTLTSFGFIAVVLISQMGQDSFFSASQLHAVIAISSVATLCSLGLLAVVVSELIGKRFNTSVYRVANKFIAPIGLIFISLAVVSLFLVPTDFYEDFLLKFTHSARFEFLLLGVSAFILIAIRRFVNASAQKT